MKYIYESPDGGKTIYRRPLGQPDAERELLTPDEVLEIEDQLIVVAEATIDDLMDSYEDESPYPAEMRPIVDKVRRKMNINLKK